MIFQNYVDMHCVSKKEVYSGIDLAHMLEDVTLLHEVQKESLMDYINVHFSDRELVCKITNMVMNAKQGLEIVASMDDEVTKAFLQVYENTIPDSAWRRYVYAVANWEAYDVCDTKEEFIALMNILDAHKESLDTLHSCNDFFCGILFSNPGTDRDIVNGLFEYHQSFGTIESFDNVMKENADFNDWTLEEELASCDIYRGRTRIINILHY